jgi:hypothetical protein
VFKKHQPYWQGNSILLRTAMALTTAASAGQQRHPAHSNGYNNRLLLARQQQPSYTQNGYNSSNSGEGSMATFHTAIDQKLQFTYP